MRTLTPRNKYSRIKDSFMLSLRPFSAFKSILFFGFGPSCSKLNKHKPLWIGCALDRKSKEVVAFNVGGRSIEMLSTIFKTVNRSAPAKVYTDYLVHYLSLVPCEVHVRGKRGTKHIERHNNLNLRTHLKRLNRKTICFTRSAAILYAILKIYFWG